MQEFHRRVTSVTPVPHTLETTSALLTGATLIPLTDSGDFTEAGGHVRRQDNGVIHVVVGMDEGDVSGVPSITLEAPGLLTDLPAESILEEWNDETETVVTDWLATVTDEVDGSSNTAYLTHTLIGMISSGISIVGASVTVRVGDDGVWWVTEVHGATPGYDPGFIRTGGLGADTVVWAGTEDGRRAQLDGIDGALECFDSSNVQTVNLDGETNYIEGTLATAASGGRVVIGSGSLGTLPTEEVRFHSGHADEVEPAKFVATGSDIGGGLTGGTFSIVGQDWTGGALSPPAIRLGNDESGNDQIELEAGSFLFVSGNVSVDADLSVAGTTDATMGAGSVGTGTFRDSVDARVTAVGGAAYQPLDADLTAFAAKTAPTGDVVGTTDAQTLTNKTLTAPAISSPTGLVKGDVGLGNVDNTSDAAKPVSTATQTALDLKASLRPAQNAQTGTTYTLALTDEDKLVTLSNAAAITLTVPTNASVAFPTGTRILIQQLGAGTVTIAGAGITFQSRGGLMNTNGQYAVVELFKKAANTWAVWGDRA